tara:strand:- start:2178 stop:2813 length:636 start_codon:yes stop_codon:yes gene_type:complete
MAKFEYTWNDGHVTSVTLPAEIGFSCNYCNPSPTMKSATNTILANAGNSSDLNEVENYCALAEPQIRAIYNASTSIKDTWDQKEKDCNNRKGLCWLCRCKDKSAYCGKTENELESCYYNWAQVPSTHLANLNSLLIVWQSATTQLAVDNQQATSQAYLDQLIAETNQMISVVAYNNESKELSLASKKAQQIFAPVIIGMVLLGLGFYLIKK